MWEIESDRFITSRLLCSLCDDQNYKVLLPCNRHTICKKCVQNPTITKKNPNKRPPEIEVTCPYCFCVGKGECAENSEANDLLELYRDLRAKGGKECQSHVLHESLYLCRTCDTEKPFCLMCFEEKHIGHIIFKTGLFTEDRLLSSSPIASIVEPPSNQKSTPPTSDDDDVGCDDDEDYREKERRGSTGKKRKVANHSVQKNSTRFLEKSKTEEGNGPDIDMFSAESKESKNRTVRELERLAPKRSKKEKNEDWMKCFYALLSYGDEHKDSEGKANYNVPRAYIYGKGEDELPLGAFVSTINFKHMSGEKYDLLLPLVLAGDFSILFGETEASSSNTKSNDSTKDEGTNYQKCSADIDKDSKELLGQQQKQEDRRLQQEKQEPHPRQQIDNQYQQHSHGNQQISHEQQSLLQAPPSSSSSSSSHCSKETVDDGYHYNNDNSKNNNITNNDNYDIDNVTLWKRRPPLPSELELKSCILYMYREPDNKSEYIRWGQIKEFNNDMNGCSNNTKILTTYVQANNIKNIEKCSYTICNDVSYFATYKDILLWGLTLKAGKHSTLKKWCTTDDSKTKVAEFFRNNQKSKLTFKDD